MSRTARRLPRPGEVPDLLRDRDDDLGDGFRVAEARLDEQGRAVVELQSVRQPGRLLVAFFGRPDGTTGFSVRWQARETGYFPARVLEKLLGRLETAVNAGNRLPQPKGGRGDDDRDGPELDGWSLVDSFLDPEGRVRLRFGGGTAGESMLVMLEPADPAAECFRSTAYFNISFNYTPGSGTRADKEDIGRLAGAVIARLERQAEQIVARFPSLLVAKAPHASIAERLLLTGAETGPGSRAPVPLGGLQLLPSGTELLFDAAGIADLLAPELRPGGVIGGAWRFAEIFLQHVNSRGDGPPSTYLLRFEPLAGGDSLGLVLAPRGVHVSNIFLSTEHFTIALQQPGIRAQVDGVEQGGGILASHLAALLKVKDHPGLSIRLPADLSEARSIWITADGSGRAAGVVGTKPAGDREAYNLAIDSPCGYRCAFCSLRQFKQPFDGGAAELDRMVHGLHVARGSGIERLRINGLDPLTHSRILDLLGTVRRLGFSQATVFSTGLPFEDDSFAAAVIARLPADHLIHFPLHGPSAEVHDAVTGTPGSFDRLTRAIANLCRHTTPGRLHGSLVMVRENIDYMFAAWRLAGQLGIGFDFHLAYPCTGSPHDVCREAMPRLTDTLEAIGRQVRADRDGAAGEARAFLTAAARCFHPCVFLRTLVGPPLDGMPWRDLRVHPRLPGTEYRDPAYRHGSTSESFHSGAVTLPCPVLKECAASGMCFGEIHQLYVELYGLSEFVPLLPREMFPER